MLREASRVVVFILRRQGGIAVRIQIGVVFGLVEDHGALAFVPNALGLLALLVGVDTFAVHFAVLPLAVVFAAIGPGEGAEAVSTVVNVLPLKLTAIRPLVKPVPMHISIKPFAGVGAIVSPLIGALAAHFTVDPVTVV